jgi:hypothetical protein
MGFSLSALQAHSDLAGSLFEVDAAGIYADLNAFGLEDLANCG